MRRQVRLLQRSGIVRPDLVVSVYFKKSPSISFPMELLGAQRVRTPHFDEDSLRRSPGTVASVPCAR